MITDRSITAILFDIDGTLVDSNYLHVDAWVHAFSDIGHPVDAWRIHRAIGMDSKMLLPTLLGDELADEIGDRAKELHSTYYDQAVPLLRPLTGALDLLHAVKERGARLVLATSAPQDELDKLLAVLDSDDAIDEVTSAEDVETAKPEPDLIVVALTKAGVSADEAVMVGDSVYDIQAATRAGVVAIGLLSGGVGAAELTDAGAIAVYEDARALLDALDDVLGGGSADAPPAVGRAA